MISLKDIYKSYYGKNNETKVLKGINLEIKNGEYICIHGKSGSGKSTLLNILAGIDPPSSGAYLFESSDVFQLSSKDIAKFRNTKIGYIFQDFKLISEFTVLENLEVPLGYAGVPKRTRVKQSLKMLERVELKGLENKYPDELSGGEKQRVAIGRALINNPLLILADEPTGNLDEATGLVIMNLLETMLNENTTLILVTHDTEIKNRARRHIKLLDGVIKDEK